tara:strand:+ start:1479 stop:1658 length:180 start_codon:yes stop_codon:yes gene_type:complete
MEEIEKKIEVVLNMLISETAWAYQRHESHTQEKSIDAFVSRSSALEKSKSLIQNKLELL